MKKNIPTWETRDGRKLPITEMSDSHLNNTIKLIERAHQAQINRVTMNPPCFQGEMAQMCADQEFNALLESEPGDLFPIYNHMLEEQQRRQRT